MNESLKKIITISSIIFSLSAFALMLILFKHHAALVTEVQKVTSLHDEKAQATSATSAPARSISSKSNNTWLDIQKDVKDTVVQVFSHVTEFNWLEPYKTPEQGEGVGSGFFINENGDIITNYHVVAQASGIEIQIPSFGLERFDVSIIGVCPERDIALLTLAKDAKNSIIAKNITIPHLKLGDSDAVLRSQEVLALGYPLGQTRLKSTLGIVSGRESGYIQITAPLNPGNSGGPALDTNGDVIGINSRGILEAQNIGYIIPINEVKSTLKDLYKVKLLRKPALGGLFTFASPELTHYLDNPDGGGGYIAKVFPETLLDNAGIKEGDMLYEINGYRVDRYGDIDVPWSEDKASLPEFLNRLMVDSNIHLVIYRSGKRMDIKTKFKLSYLPPTRMIYPEFEQAAIDYEVLGGMVVMSLSLNHVGLLLQRQPNLIRYSKAESQHEPAVIITNILPNSQAFKARVLRPSQLITEVNGEKIKTLNDFRAAILKSKTSRYITIQTDENYYSVLSIDKILAEEDILAARYFFEKSPLLKQFEIPVQHDTKKINSVVQKTP